MSALTVVFVNSKSFSSVKIGDAPVDDPSLKILVANSSDTLRLLKMSSCPHVSSDGRSYFLCKLTDGFYYSNNELPIEKYTPLDHNF